MINVDELKIFIDFVANKEQSGTSYSIPQLNNIFQAANIDLFKLRYGLPEEYSPTMPLPRQSYEITQKIKDDLRACKVVANLPVVNGEMMLPSDYVHETDMTYRKILNADCGEAPTVHYRPIQMMDDDKWSERRSNIIKKPSTDFPIANILSDRIRIEPKSIKSVEFSYLRIPSKPIWAYTFDSNNIEKYDPVNSVDFDWNGILFTDIAKLVLGYIGINLRDQELQGAIDNYKVKGV